MSTHPTEIREATRTDLDGLVLLLEAQRVFHGQQPAPGRSREFLRHQLDQRGSVLLVARMREVVGFARLDMTYSSLSLSPMWTLADLFVAEGARRRGIGRLLLERARQHAIEAGARELVLFVAAENRDAQSVYERSGWKRDHKYHTYVLDLGS